MVERIVVGDDGSAGADRAVAWAAGLATATSADVVVVHARGLLDALHERRPDHDPPGARHVERDGNPVEVLLAVADEEEADLIVVGSRGVGTYPEQLLGSTSTQVAQRSTRPVVIVPAR